MKDSYGIARLAVRYERLFEKKFLKVRNERERYTEELQAIIEQAQNALDIETEQIEIWASTMQVVYEVDDANTLWKKIQLCIMKWYVNWMYDKAVKECACIGPAIETFKKLLNRLHLLSAF